MGGLTSLFGPSASKSTSTQESKNLAYPQLQQSLNPFIGQAGQSSGMIANLLGLNGQQGQSQGFNDWRGSTGYKFGLDQGTGAITGGAASKGLLNSGSTGKALMQYGQDYAGTKYNDYLSQLQGLISPGMQSAQTIASAGQVSNQNSRSIGAGDKGGIGGVAKGVLGTLLSK